MPSRGDKEGSKITTPPQTAIGSPPTYVASSANHDFYLQSAMEIQRSIGKLEASMESLQISAGKHGSQLDDLSKEVISAKAFIKGVIWVLGIFGSIGLALLAFILNTLVHHLK